MGVVPETVALLSARMTRSTRVAAWPTSSTAPRALRVAEEGAEKNGAAAPVEVTAVVKTE